MCGWNTAIPGLSGFQGHGILNFLSLTIQSLKYTKEKKLYHARWSRTYLYLHIMGIY